MKRCFGLLAIVVLATVAAAGEKKPVVRVAGTYTNLEYHEESGDLVGVEVKIVPVDDGFQAAVLVSEGAPQPLVVVTVSAKGGAVRFDVPGQNGTSWSFIGTIGAKALTGTITYESGYRQKIVLQRRCGYWDR
jgi:hypothetical protein